MRLKKMLTKKEKIKALSYLLKKRLYDFYTQKSKIDSLDEIEDVVSKYIFKTKNRVDNISSKVKTGFLEIDALTGGFRGGDIVVIASRPSLGKSSLALNIAQNVLDNCRGVAILSFEMPQVELISRLISAKSSIPLKNIQTGTLNEEEKNRLEDALDTISHQKLFINSDDDYLNIDQTIRLIRRAKLKHKELSLCIIDYLQLINGNCKRDRSVEISEIMKKFKLLARELHIPIVILSQLNRSLEGREDKRPRLLDLRESGSIEEIADIVMFVYREEFYLKREDQYRKEKAQESAEIIIAKNKKGATGVAYLKFQKNSVRFVNIK